MKKLLLILLAFFATFAADAKCDFSKVRLLQSNTGTYYKWKLTGWDRDTCKDFMFLVYDFQTKKTDTLQDINGYTDVSFNAPGNYKLYVKLWDKCQKCDTSMFRAVEILHWSPKASFFSKLVTCDSLVGEMTLMTTVKDTCWEHYYYIYQGPELDSLSDNDFSTMSDYAIYNYYSFPDPDLKKYTTGTRVLKYKFPYDGKYLIFAQYYNKCLNQDTFFMKRFNIKCKTSSVQSLSKPKPNLIGIYDMMGRPVANIRENEILIYVYSDGTRKKVYTQR